MHLLDSAHVWHVAKTGSDSNSGHAAQYPVNLANDAKLTIAAAITAASAGDTIIIHPGTYAETVSVGKALNLIGTHPTLCKANSFTFTSGASGSYGYQLSVDGIGSSAIQLQGSDDVTLERCRAITTNIDGFYLTAYPERVRLIECYGKSGYDGIQAGDCIDSIFERCLFESTGTTGTARALTTTSNCRNLLIKDCILRASTSSNLAVYGGNIQGQAVLQNCTIQAHSTARTRAKEVVGVGCQYGGSDGHALVIGGSIDVSGGSPTLALWGKVGYLAADKITMKGELPDVMLQTYMANSVSDQVVGAEKYRFQDSVITPFSSDDDYNGWLLTWLTGNNAGETAWVDDYVDADGEIRFDAADAFTYDIEVGDEYRMDVICYGVKQEDTAVVAVGKIALNGLPTNGDVDYWAVEEMDSNSTQLAAIVEDTNELQTDLTDGGRLDLLVDGIKAKTDNLPADPADDSDIDAQLAAITTHLTDIKGTGFAKDTHSLPQCLTATGFSTLDAAGVRAAVGLASANLDTQLDTIETNTLNLLTQIGIAGAGLSAVPWNPIWNTQVQSEVSDALSSGVNIVAIVGDSDAAAALDKAAKMLAHKTSQDKSTGIISIYNAAGTAVEYTKTQSNGAATWVYEAIATPL